MLFALLSSSRRAGPCSTPTGSRDNAARTAARCSRSSDPARADLRRRRHACSRASRAAARRHATRARYPTGRPVRPRGRLHFVRSGSAGLERYAQRRAHRAQTRVRARSSTSSRASSSEGDDVHTTLDPAAQRVALQRARRPRRLGGRARPAHRRGQGDGERARLRPEPASAPATFGELNRDPDAPLLNRATQARLPAGLDVQGRDRDGRDRQRASTRRDSVVDGESPKTISRRAADQRRRRELRRHHAHRRADELGQHGLGRRSARSSASATMDKYMERFGFDRKPPIDLPARRDAPRAASARKRPAAPADRRRRRHRAHGDRPGASLHGHAAADGDGRRRGRQRRQADEAAARRPDRRPGRPHRAERDQAARSVAGDAPETAARSPR